MSSQIGIATCLALMCDHATPNPPLSSIIIGKDDTLYPVAIFRPPLPTRSSFVVGFTFGMKRAHDARCHISLLPAPDSSPRVH